MRTRSTVRRKPVILLGLLLLGLLTLRVGGQEGPNSPLQKAGGAPTLDAALRKDAADTPAKLSAEERLLTKKRDELKGLEDLVEARRKAVNRTFRDDAMDHRIRVLTAETVHGNAELAVDEASIALTEYLQGTFPQEREALRGEIALAEADRDRAKERFDRSGGKGDGLALEKAKLILEKKMTELLVLEKYTKPQRVVELQATIDKAKADERAKRVSLEIEKAKAESLQKRALQFEDRSLESHVLTLLDEAIEKEAQAVAILKDLANQAKATKKDDPAEAEKLADQLKAKRADASRLMDEAQHMLSEAASLGSDVRNRRIELMEAEQRLQNARNQYERLVQHVASKWKDPARPAAADANAGR